MADENVNTDIDDWLNDLDEDEGDSEELDQSDIDSLLGGDDAEEAVAAEAGEEIADELDQSDIDSLLGSGEDEEQGEENDGTIDQEEMDQLFASSDDEDGQDMSSNEVDFAEILGDNSDDELPDFGAETEFDADSFTLDSDDDNTIVDSGDTAFPPLDQDVTQPTAGSTQAQPQQSQPMPPPPLAAQEPFFKSRVFYGLLGVLVALLFGSGIYLGLFGGSDEEVAINVKEEKPAADREQAVTVTEKPNLTPVAMGNLYKISKDGKAIQIVLTGNDAEGAPLSFEVVKPPSYGQLSGNAPLLNYLPAENFQGEDRFTFRSGDGTLFSSPATIFISGPDLVALKNEEEKKIKKKAKEIKIAAKDISFETFSTDSFVINWMDVWKKSNSISYNDSVSVELDMKGLHGKITKISSQQHRYTPAKFFQGEEFISYRFKKAGKYSPRRIVKIGVVMGDHRPEIIVKKMEDQYLSGQVVTIDARSTMDDQRNSVSFSWQQLAGVPVQLEARNQEASVVAFVMPSSFYMERDGGVVMQVIATDRTGKASSRDINIQSTSRRQAALWRASSDGSVLDEPDCPYGDCPGQLLPWPYQN